MARNEEKAQSMLNRWWSLKKGEDGPRAERRRPFSPARSNNIVSCEKWRLQVLREIGKKVTEVQNAALGEHKLRELNDEINKLIREKGQWERRILELGGPNYLHSGPDVGGSDAGQEAPGQPGGYKYFGAARELAGVKELFAQPVVDKKKRTRQELYKLVDADYYGFRDDDDGVLEALERQVEGRDREQALSSWHKQFKVDTKASQSITQLAVPTAEQMEQALLERRKKELLLKYAS